MNAEDDSQIIRQLEKLAPVEVGDCLTPEQQLELFNLSSRLYSEEVTAKLSRLIDYTFLTCPRFFMSQLMQMERSVQVRIIDLFGRHEPPLQVSGQLRMLQQEQLFFEFIKENFSDFGVYQ
ncbi:MAG TPA: hypothetical protein VFV64_13300 [Permianibacter sp.]|nr:hypothetical protein [Permianibacter sp.]